MHFGFPLFPAYVLIYTHTEHTYTFLPMSRKIRRKNIILCPTSRRLGVLCQLHFAFPLLDIGISRNTRTKSTAILVCLRPEKRPIQRAQFYATLRDAYVSCISWTLVFCCCPPMCWNIRPELYTILWHSGLLVKGVFLRWCPPMSWDVYSTVVYHVAAPKRNHATVWHYVVYLRSETYTEL